ncbi:hypothetical protein AB7952_09805 [Streptomyces sp. PG2]
MLKKFFVSAAVAATAVAGLALGAGTASAATFVPAGVYPSSAACADAGNAGFPQGPLGRLVLRGRDRRPVPAVGAADVLIRVTG